jgi:hypothetical protein
LAIWNQEFQKRVRALRGAENCSLLKFILGGSFFIRNFVYQTEKKHKVICLKEIFAFD